MSANILPYKTPVALSATIRERMVKLLNQILADAVEFQLQARQAQWNVKGAYFMSLHLLFDQIANEVEDAASEIASRVGELGGIAMAIRQFTGASHLPEYPLGISSGDQHVAAVSCSLASFAASLEEAVKATCDDHDLDSMEVLSHVWRKTDQLQFIVQSYLERRRPEIGVVGCGHDGRYELAGDAA